MLAVRFDNGGAQKVQWPQADRDVLALGQRYVAAQQALPAAERFPQLAAIEARLAAAEAGRSAAQQGETGRSVISSTEMAAFEEAQLLVRQIVATLKARHLTELLVIEQWGVPVTLRRNGPRARTPEGKTAVLQMLTQYIAKESSLPEGERITNPSLDEVITTHQTLSDAITSRTEAQTKREKGVDTRLSEVKRLRRMLQAAAVYHLVFEFGGVVDNRLQELGFAVTAV